MHALRWIAICFLALAVTACSPWNNYGAGQTQKYTGLSTFRMYEEWGPPVSRTLFPGGGRFYQFRKQGTDCGISAWASDLDIVYRLAVSGPETCAAG